MPNIGSVRVKTAAKAVNCRSPVKIQCLISFLNHPFRRCFSLSCRRAACAHPAGQRCWGKRYAQHHDTHRARGAAQTRVGRALQRLRGVLSDGALSLGRAVVRAAQWRLQCLALAVPCAGSLPVGNTAAVPSPARKRCCARGCPRPPTARCRHWGRCWHAWHGAGWQQVRVVTAMCPALTAHRAHQMGKTRRPCRSDIAQSVSSPHAT